MTNAAIPDLDSVSEQQKLAILKSLSDSDKEILLEQLQKEMGKGEGQPLEQPDVVLPLPGDDTQEQADDAENDKDQQEAEEKLQQEWLTECEAENSDLVLVENYDALISDCLATREYQAEVAELEPFGYDLFSGVPTTFAPV
ncbi:MAG: hypothetical protein HKN88_02850, partial [Gammaproteobacteria bacterium]|nr:hypothetical protein [Gammaproteobacteria bacterium]